MTDARITAIGSEALSQDVNSTARVTQVSGEVSGLLSTATARITQIASEALTINNTEDIRITRIMAEVASRASTDVVASIDATEDFEDDAAINITVANPPATVSIEATEDFEDTAEIHIYLEVKGDCKQYTDLVTMEHRDKPNFMDMVCYSTQAFADNQLKYKDRFVLAYDVDNAVGNQLDVVGQWVGIHRRLLQPIENVFFSFDTVGLGFDQGVWLGPYDTAAGVTYLPDDFYRLLIKMKIVNNHWDGTKEGAYEIMNTVFNTLGYNFFIEDHGDLSISLGLLGPNYPVPLVFALFTSGKFNVKPAGIRIREYKYQSNVGKVFSFDLETDLFGGFDDSSWAILA